MTRRHQNLLARSWRLGDKLLSCSIQFSSQPLTHQCWGLSLFSSSSPKLASFLTTLRSKTLQLSPNLASFFPAQLLHHVHLLNSFESVNCFCVYTLHIQIDLETAGACQTFESFWGHLGFLRHGNINLGAFLGWGQMKCSTGGGVCFVYNSKAGCSVDVQLVVVK